MLKRNNIRPIFQEEMNAMRDLAVFKLGSELLPALDNLARIEQVGKKQNMNDILKGIEIIDKQFHDILQRFKIQKLESKGKEFDPNSILQLQLLILREKFLLAILLMFLLMDIQLGIKYFV